MRSSESESCGAQPQPRRRLVKRWLFLVAIPLAAGTLWASIQIARYVGLLKPPRPMYCNVYGYTHRGDYFKSWGPSSYMSDTSGRIGWADFTDNALLIVDPLKPKLVPPWSLQPGLNSTNISLGDSDVVATVSRKTNVLVLIRNDGQIAEYRINEGIAKTFHDENVFHNNTMCPSLIDAARNVLIIDDKEAFDVFLRARQ